MTKALPKTRPANFVSDLPPSNQRALAIGRHNAAEFRRIFGIEVAPYEVRQSGCDKIVVIPEFVWDKWFTRPLKKVRWTCAFHFTEDCFTTQEKWNIE